VPLQNRVTPLGELVADPARGLVYGNRGCLHDDQGRIRRRHNGKRWIACRLRFKGWHRHPLLQPGRFTELFFLDEATAFAAGHRPCALCRREDYTRFVAIWRDLHPGRASADVIDEQLHSERLGPDVAGRRIHHASFGDLPDGAFVVSGAKACLGARRAAASMDGGRVRGGGAEALRRRAVDHPAVAPRGAACGLDAGGASGASDRARVTQSLR
jgi:hypothetical protein